MFSALNEKVERLEKENEDLKARLLEMDTRFFTIEARLLEHENQIYPKCKLCKALIYPTDPTINFGAIKLHKNCSKCTTCKCNIDQSNYYTMSDSHMTCKSCNLHFRKVTGD